ncbi:MAG: YcbK family protein [Campylobacterales bacterium]
MDRREFLITSVGVSAFLLPEFANAFDVSKVLSKLQKESATNEEKAPQIIKDDINERFIWLTRRDSGEQFKEVFFANGKYNYDAYKKFCWLMRDLRGDDEVASIDANLLNVAYKIQNTLLGLNIRKPININSGYRSPKTNANTEGAAKNSFHTKGKAIDISIEGLDASLVGHLGRIMANGGVGFYPMKNFIHLDTGDKRQWIVDSKNDFKMLSM